MMISKSRVQEAQRERKPYTEEKPTTKPLSISQSKISKLKLRRRKLRLMKKMAPLRELIRILLQNKLMVRLLKLLKDMPWKKQPQSQLKKKKRRQKRRPAFKE